MKTRKILFVTFMAIVFCLSTVLVVFAACNPTIDSEQEQENVIADNGGMTTDDEVLGSGVMLMSSVIPVELYDQYDIAPIAESAYTLNATVTPANATYTQLDWTIDFANPSSSWANGKKVADYVTLNANGLKATISCLQAFGEQVVVKATSVDNTNMSATCTFDYRKRVTNATVTLQPSSGSAITLGTNANTVSAIVACNVMYTVKVNVTEGVGTLGSGYVIKDSQAALIDNFFTIIGTSGAHMEPEGRLSENRVRSSFNLGRSDFQMLLAVDDWACDMDYEDEYTDRVISAMASVGTSKNLAVWHLLLTNAKGTQILEKTFYFAINISALRIGVTGVSFGNTNYIFE